MTVAGERQGLEKWKAFLGRVRLDNITPGMVAAFRDQRLIEGRPPHTVNLNVQHLRNVLKKAADAAQTPRAQIAEAPAHHPGAV